MAAVGRLRGNAEVLVAALAAGQGAAQAGALAGLRARTVRRRVNDPALADRTCHQNGRSAGGGRRRLQWKLDWDQRLVAKVVQGVVGAEVTASPPWSRVQEPSAGGRTGLGEQRPCRRRLVSPVRGEKRSQQAPCLAGDQAAADHPGSRPAGRTWG